MGEKVGSTSRTGKLNNSSRRVVFIIASGIKDSVYQQYQLVEPPFFSLPKASVNISIAATLAVACSPSFLTALLLRCSFYVECGSTQWNHQDYSIFCSKFLSTFTSNNSYKWDISMGPMSASQTYTSHIFPLPLSLSPVPGFYGKFGKLFPANGREGGETCYFWGLWNVTCNLKWAQEVWKLEVCLGFFACN